MIIFADKSGNIALADLDANFAEVGVYAETAGKVLDAVQDNIRQIGPLTAPLVVSGNITATTGYYFHGDGSKLTNLPIANSTYGNSNVASYLPTYTGAFSPSNINASGIVQGLSMISRGAITANGVVTGAGFSTGGDVDSRGTIIGRNFSTSGNANVTNNVNANNMTATGQITASGNISATGNLITLGYLQSSGNVNAQNFYANGNIYIAGWSKFNDIQTGAITTNANINGAGSINLTGTIQGGNISTGGNVTATGNIIGNYIIGDGSLLTNLPGGGGNSTYGNANVAAYLPFYTGSMPLMAGAVTTSANITGGNLITAGTVSANTLVGNGSQITNVLRSTQTRNVFVSTTSPTVEQGSPGDIWYQTY